MSSTTVTGTIHGVDNQPLVNKYIYFRLKSVGTDSGDSIVIDRDRISAITDQSGQFSVVLWDNGESGVESLIEIKLPSRERIDVIIPVDTTSVDLWDLIENYQPGSVEPQLPSNESLFVRKSNNLSDLSDVSVARTNLGVAVGTDVQAHSSALDATDASFTAAKDSKLTGIEAGAQVNDSTTLLDADIGTTVQAHSTALDGTTASFTTADKTRLDSIAVTGAEIKTAYEAEPDTNAFTNAYKTKLDGVGGSADETNEASVTSALSATSSLADITTPASSDRILIQDASATFGLKYVSFSEFGTGSGDMLAGTYDPNTVAGDVFDMDNMVNGTTNKLFTATDETKLDAIEALADVTDETNVVSALDGASLTDIGTPSDSDRVLIQDNSSSNGLKYVSFSEFAAPADTSNTTIRIVGVSTTTITSDDFMVVGARSADQTFTLPDASTVDESFSVTIKKDRESGILSIATSAGQTIDGSTSAIELQHDGDVATVTSNGSNGWYITTGEVNTIDSDTTGEPTGSDQVLNVVSLTQAEYTAGTKVATTLYVITD